MQASPAKEVTQRSPSLPKASLKTLQSSPKKDIDNDSVSDNINGVSERENDGFVEPDLDNSAPMEEITPDVETKV